VAGAGTKLRPHTYTQPKALIPLAGRTILSIIIDQLVDAGITEFVFVVGYLGEKIQHYVEKKYPQLTCHFVQQNSREGTGHAILLTRDVVGNDEILIVLGDTICECDFKEVIASPYSMLGLKKVDDPRNFGVAELDEQGKITRVVEKPQIPKSNLALVGLYKIKETQQLYDCLHEPKLLILDEPFSGLDPINSNLIKQEIFNLSQQGTTIIFSTHRMEQVEEICDHIMLINKGRKILDGGVQQIQQDFKQGLFKVGLGTMPNPAQMATWHFNIVQTHDKAFTVKMNEDSTTNDILLHFIRQDIPVTYFEEILPSINEVFITQVQQTENSTANVAALPLV
jgi:UTP-glucose-1-phosphate uridylyltransferase